MPRSVQASFFDPPAPPPAAVSSVSSAPSLADQFQEAEAALLAEYWSILRSSQPAEWIEEDKRAFLGKLAAHCGRMADVLRIGEERGEMSLAWEQLHEAYQALEQYLTERSIPPYISPARAPRAKEG